MSACSNSSDHHYVYATTELVLNSNPAGTSAYNDIVGTWERAVCEYCGAITKTFIPTKATEGGSQDD